MLGRKTPIDIDVRSDAPGLRSCHRASASGRHDLSSCSARRYPKSGWRGSGVTEKRLHVEADLLQLKVPEGPATIEVFADTYAWHLFAPTARAAACPRRSPSI